MKQVEQLFRLAAEKIDGSARRTPWYSIYGNGYTHQAGCEAIHSSTVSIVGGGWHVANDKLFNCAHKGFSKVFKPRNYDVYWFGEPCCFLESINTKRKNHRVFAMLFMAELAKDQGI